MVFSQQSLFGMVQNVRECPGLPRNRKRSFREKCPDCRGTGYVSSRKRIKVNIPAGIDNGQSVRIRDKGEPGHQRRPQRRSAGRGCGIPRILFSSGRECNIYSTAPISYAQAVLGGETRIHTVDGDVIYEVKPGTQTDTRIRLKGKEFRPCGIRITAATTM